MLNHWVSLNIHPPNILVREKVILRGNAKGTQGWGEGDQSNDDKVCDGGGGRPKV